MGAVALLFSCGGGKSDKVKPKSQVNVEVLTVEPSAEGHYVVYPAEVTASGIVTITAPHSGIFSGVAVSRGDAVSKGDSLVYIDSKSVKGSYDFAMATLSQAEDAHSRVKSVHDKGSVADVKMVEVETALSKARAMAFSAQESLNECTVKSPFDGIVSDIYAEQGVSVSIGEPLFRVVDLSTVKIKISVPEKEIASMEKGTGALIDVPALNLYSLSGEVTSKGVVGSPLSHTYDCYLQPLSQIENLMPGMICKVRFPQNGLEEMIIIPSSAVDLDNQGKYVWVVTDGKVSKRYIKVGGFAGKGVNVTEGLNIGDKVIISGASKVSSGMNVNVL